MSLTILEKTETVCRHCGYSWESNPRHKFVTCPNPKCALSEYTLTTERSVFTILDWVEGV